MRKTREGVGGDLVGGPERQACKRVSEWVWKMLVGRTHRTRARR